MMLPTTPTVLVLDDRRDVAAIIAEMCRSLGVETVAPEGEAIAALLDRHRPAALIVDVMMPDEDGYEVLKILAGRDPGLPVLLVTGYGDTWLRMGATLGEGHGLRNLQTAAKPVRLDDLRRFLAPLLPVTPA